MISVSRGAMLAFLIPVCLAAVLGGKVHRVLPILAIAGTVFPCRRHPFARQPLAHPFATPFTTYAESLTTVA